MRLLEGKTVLVVDDEVDLRTLLSQSFRMYGATVIEAAGGHAAWKIFQEQPAGSISAIVSDVRMADGDGVELMGRVRASGGLIPRIVLVTGFADITESEILLRGADKVLAKPFRIKDIVTALLEDLKTQTAA